MSSLDFSNELEILLKSPDLNVFMLEKWIFSVFFPTIFDFAFL